MESKLKGGLADKEHKDITDFSPEQLIKAMKVEREHTPDPQMQLEIGMDHLTEDDKYYDKPMFKDEIEGKSSVKEAHYVGQCFALANLEKMGK